MAEKRTVRSHIVADLFFSPSLAQGLNLNPGGRPPSSESEGR
jgi:hypothetical protein